MLHPLGENIKWVGFKLQENQMKLMQFDPNTASSESDVLIIPHFRRSLLRQIISSDAADLLHWKQVKYDFCFNFIQFFQTILIDQFISKKQIFPGHPHDESHRAAAIRIFDSNRQPKRPYRPHEHDFAGPA